MTAAKWCVGCGAPLVDVRCSNILCRNFDGPSAAMPQLPPDPTTDCPVCGAARFSLHRLFCPLWWRRG